MRFLVIFIFVSTVLFLAAFFWRGSGKVFGTGGTVSLGGENLKVAVADTDALRGRGLSGVPEMPRDSGMLFVFDTEGRPGFWMKYMRFPIDILWFDADRKLVDVTENFSPDSFPSIANPAAPAKFVLEINAGEFKKRGLKIGDILGEFLPD